MGKIITRVIVFLLLGAIVNVAVALMASRDPLSDPIVLSRVPSPAHQLAWLHGKPSTFSQDLATVDHRSTWIWEHENLIGDMNGGVQVGARGAILTIPFSMNWEIGTFVRVGWPMRSLEGEEWLRGAPAVVVAKRWLLARPSSPVSAVIPFKPILLGFAINTVFYAVILWVLFAAPFALRRRRRIRRGLCPACAYPVGDSPVCTECGKTVRAARASNIST